MMRALWTAASGMKSQQMNVDTIANNLANVNTSGYKKENMEFKSLLYETMTKALVDENGAGQPVNLQVGHGVRPVAVVKNYSQGNLDATEGKFDFAIDGKGFFTVRGENGENYYTRDGNFKTAVVDNDIMLVTSDGLEVLDIDEEPIIIPGDIDVSRIVINRNGEIMAINDEDTAEDLGIKFKLVQFKNPQGLEAKGRNLLLPTTGSGEPIAEEDDDTLQKSTIMQGYIESSNVQVVEEMVKMIVAQRAYELNSKAIQTSDEMLSQANQLKRS